MKKVLHIIPESAVSSRTQYLGSTKDIRTRTEYFCERGIPFDEFVAIKRSDSLLLNELRQFDMTSYRIIVFELPNYPQSLAYLRKQYPHLILVTRSINAELYHRIHYFLASLRIRHTDLYKAVFDNRVWLKIAFQGLYSDYLCARYSHYILAITEWEKKYYWNLLKNHRSVKVVPYFLASQFYQEVTTDHKNNQCVCLMSPGSKHTPFLLDALNNLSRLINLLEQDYPHWNFFVTGELVTEKDMFAKRLTRTGFLETPLPLLAQSRALAVLSDFGFGFKTKVLDAILTKNYILVTGGLYKRLPELLKPYCIRLNKKSVSAFKGALDQCEKPYPPGNPNDTLCRQAFQSLDQIFWGTK